MIQKNQVSLRNYLREDKKMCSKVMCDRCKKWTWSGCGQHVEEALAGVPQDQVCTCTY